MNCKGSMGLLVAFAIMLNGCGIEDLFRDESAVVEKTVVQELHECIVHMKDIWDKENQEDELESSIDYLLDTMNESAARYSDMQLDYYADWNNTDLKTAYDAAYEEYYVIYEMLEWAFVNGAHKSKYADLFTPYASEEHAEYYLAYPLVRIENFARDDSEDYGGDLDDYYSAAYDEDVDVTNERELNDLNVECAKLYLKTLKSYDLREYTYDTYVRDYTAQDVSAVYKTILSDFYPLCDAYYEALKSHPDYARIRLKHNLKEKDPFKSILNYGSRLSPSIAESAKKLYTEKLYYLASGSKCYDGSYTVAYPGRQSAKIYLYTDDSYIDLQNAIHEFGHFHSEWRDTTPIFLQKNCSDIAEVQSQGMQLLFTQYYDEIYGEDADFMEQLAVFDILDSIVSGFAIGEFEYQVMKQIDTISEYDVVDLFYEIADSCNLERDLYEISHLFEQPGYYISYGVSALASLEIYGAMQESPEQAVKLYEKISNVSSVDAKYGLREALSACGFSDIFNPSDLDALLHKIPVLS